MTNRSLILLVFGDTVRTRRRRLGLTQQMLSNKTGLHRTCVSDIEGAEEPNTGDDCSIRPGARRRAGRFAGGTAVTNFLPRMVSNETPDL